MSRLAVCAPVLVLGAMLVNPALQAQSFDKTTLAWTLPWDADWVTAVTFVGPRRLAAGNNLGDILVWDLPEKAGTAVPSPIRHLVGHSNTVNRLSTPDQRWLLSASSDHTVRYWDLDASGADAGVVTLNARGLREAESKKKKAPMPVTAKVTVQKPSQVLTEHHDWVLGLSLTRDGKQMVTGDDNKEVIVWDRPEGKVIRRWQLQGWAWAVAVEPEGKAVLVSERIPLVFDSGQRTGLKLWNPQTGAVIADLSKDVKDRIGAAAFSPDGKWLAIGPGGEGNGLSGKIILLDPATGKKLKELTPGHEYGVTDIAFHPDGKHVLSTGRDTTVKIWNLAEGKLVKSLGQPRGGQFKDWLHAVAISPDGRFIAAADMAGQVQVWTVP